VFAVTDTLYLTPTTLNANLRATVENQNYVWEPYMTISSGDNFDSISQAAGTATLLSKHSFPLDRAGALQ